MTAKIDIKHPSGRSLEGFPHELKGFEYGENRLNLILGEMFNDCISDLSFQDPVIHKGDIITIEIL